MTDAGREAFRNWINTQLDYPRERDPMHLKAAYLEWADPESARSQLQAHAEHYGARLLQWQQKIKEIDGGTSDMLNRRLATVPAGDHDRVAAFKRFTYEGLTARAESEIAWAQRGLALLDELYA